MPRPSRGASAASSRMRARHAHGIGHRLRIDVGVSRVRRVRHRRAPGLPSELAASAATTRMPPRPHGRAAIAWLEAAARSRSPRPRSPRVERQDVPRRLVRDEREDRRRDDRVAGQITRPEESVWDVGSGPPAQAAATRWPLRRLQREHHAFAPRSPPDDEVREQADVVMPWVRVADRLDAAVDVRPAPRNGSRKPAGSREERRVEQHGDRIAAAARPTSAAIRLARSSDWHRSARARQTTRRRPPHATSAAGSTMTDVSFVATPGRPQAGDRRPYESASVDRAADGYRKCQRESRRTAIPGCTSANRTPSRATAAMQPGAGATPPSGRFAVARQQSRRMRRRAEHDSHAAERALIEGRERVLAAQPGGRRVR